MSPAKRLGPEEEYDAMIIACRPDSPPSNPKLREIYNQLAPLEPGSTTGICVGCGHGILIGPRQLKLIEDAPAVLVLCMECSAEVAAATGASMAVRHLGGK